VTHHPLVSRLFSSSVLIILALASLIACVLLKPKVLPRPAYNFQLTYDISQSMNVQDYIVDEMASSRLSMAKKATTELLQKLPCGSNIGFSVFTGRRVVTLVTPVEVCQHYAGLLNSLNMIDDDMRWAESSGIGKGLHQSIRSVDGIGNSTRVIFMTDGQEAPPLRADHRGMPNTDKFSTQGIIVGLGGTTPVRIPKTFDKDGRVSSYWQAHEVVQRSDTTLGPSHEELSKRQDSHLSKLGRLANLVYLPLDTTEQLADVAMVESLAHQKMVSVDLRWIPASFALLLLCLRFVPNSFLFFRQKPFL